MDTAQYYGRESWESMWREMSMEETGIVNIHNVWMKQELCLFIILGLFIWDWELFMWLNIWNCMIMYLYWPVFYVERVTGI